MADDKNIGYWIYKAVKLIVIVWISIVLLGLIFVFVGSLLDSSNSTDYLYRKPLKVNTP